MNVQQAKQVALVSLLAHLGFTPLKQANEDIWYPSPFHKFDYPFKINFKSNLWYDFGLGQGGNVIDFVQQFYNLDFSAALAKFDEFNNLASTPVAPVAPSTKPKSNMELLKLIPLESRALKRYLHGRGISAEIAAPYVQEMHYRRGGKSYYAICFPNQIGGYELRNRYFKGAYGSKAISVLGDLDDAQSVAVFEGWIDFLSYLVHIGCSAEAPAIVLNSVAMGGRAIELIKSAEIKQVDLYFDRDEAGKALTTRFQAELAATVIDRSNLYEGYKDFNDFLIASRSNQQSFRLHG